MLDVLNDLLAMCLNGVVSTYVHDGSVVGCMTQIAGSIVASIFTEHWIKHSSCIDNTLNTSRGYVTILYFSISYTITISLDSLSIICFDLNPNNFFWDDFAPLVSIFRVVSLVQSSQATDE